MNKKDPVIAMLNVAAQTIFDKKGLNILALDVRGVSTLTDFFLIAEGTVDRHVKALSTAVKDTMSKMGEEPVHVEGDDTGDWVVMDYGDILIHLFRPEFREKYALEQVWSEGEIIDLEISLEKQT